uniref:Ataxin 7 like 2 n=1 Tax=Homo sapiens TaxID=9606 RepID=A0A804HKL0_HUMAN
MAVRERAAAAMAALERRVPSLDDFAGQSWSSWVERADLPAADGLLPCLLALCSYSHLL